MPSLYLLYRLDGRTVISQLLKLEIKVIQTGNKLHFRRVTFNDNELLGEDAFYDKPAAIMLQSCLTKQLIETDIFLFIEPERVLVTRSFRFRSISEGGLSGWYPYMA